MVRTRRPGTASPGGGSPFSAGTVIVLLTFVAAFVLFLFLRQYGFFESGDRMGAAKRYVESYKQFFVTEPVKYTVYDIPLLIRANDLGSEFWSRTFPAILREAQDETDKLLAYEEIINRREERGEHREIDLSDAPRLFDFLDRARRFSEQGLYNIASGDIFDFWDIAVERYENWVRAKEAQDSIRRDLELKKTEISAEEKEKKQKELMRLERIIAKNRFLPDMKALTEFIPYAKPSAVVLNAEKKSIRLASANVRVHLRFFREALFLDILREKLPTGMNYLIYYGNRHGIWKLPKEYVRWTISVDDPQVVLGDRSLGAVKLIEEQGAWAVVRVNEEVVRQDGRTYFLPIDWRTGLPVKHNLSALVIAPDTVSARMQAYALFIASPEERARFEKDFPQTPYVIVAREDVVHREHIETHSQTVAYLKKLLSASPEPLTRPEILTAVVEFEKAAKIPAEGPKIPIEISFVERRPVLVIPPVSRNRFVTKEEIRAAREKQRQRLDKEDPFKKWAREHPDD